MLVWVFELGFLRLLLVCVRGLQEETRHEAKELLGRHDLCSGDLVEILQWDVLVQRAGFLERLEETCASCVGEILIGRHFCRNLRQLGARCGTLGALRAGWPWRRRRGLLLCLVALEKNRVNVEVSVAEIKRHKNISVELYVLLKGREGEQVVQAVQAELKQLKEGYVCSIQVQPTC